MKCSSVFIFSGFLNSARLPTSSPFSVPLLLLYIFICTLVLNSDQISFAKLATAQDKVGAYKVSNWTWRLGAINTWHQHISPLRSFIFTDIQHLFLNASNTGVTDGNLTLYIYCSNSGEHGVSVVFRKYCTVTDHVLCKYRVLPTWEVKKSYVGSPH